MAPYQTKGKTMKMIKRYEIREFGRKGSCYSHSIFRRVVELQQGRKIVKRLKRSGRDVVLSPIMVSA